MNQTADAVVCGAGIAGIATAHALSVTHGLRRVLLIDEGAPMSLTSDKSTEAYRNWWPGPDSAMVEFMNRSIDMLERWSHASDNRFLLNRRGYVYATASRTTAARMMRDARRAEAQGAGDLRVYDSLESSATYAPSTHTGFASHPVGADLFIDQHGIREHFPWLASDIVAVLHARRCGWFSGQQLGALLLEQTRAAGTSLMQGRVEGVHRHGGRVCGVTVTTVTGASVRIDSPVFVNAAGPFAKEVASLAGTSLPVFSEAHYKIAFEDRHGIVDRNAGLVILDDPQTIEWDDETRDALASEPSTRWMTEPLPAGIHLRPEGYHGSMTVLMLWDYHSAHRYSQATFPLDDDPYYPEVVMRGMTRLAPGLAAYLDRLPHSYVDGGYYTKTRENRPLIGPMDVPGSYVCAAFSGFGLMAAPVAGELVAAHITGGTLPSYANAFTLDRYQRPDYLAMLDDWGATGQL